MSISIEPRSAAPQFATATPESNSAAQPVQEVYTPAAKGSEPALPHPANEPDRRQKTRHTTLYRPCCIENGDRAQVGLIRNWSEDGAQIETTLDVQIGDVISYFWDGLPAVECLVAWSEDGRIGVEHSAPVNIVAPDFPQRTVRIPTGQCARLWAGETGKNCQLANISLVGVQIFGVAPVPVGTLVSIEIGGRLFTSCSVRWCDNGSMGLKFDERLRATELSKLLD